MFGIGKDRVTDFVSGVDEIDISTLEFNFIDLQTHMVDTASGLLITYKTHLILLMGVHSVVAGDFIFGV